MMKKDDAVQIGKKLFPSCFLLNFPDVLMAMQNRLIEAIYHKMLPFDEDWMDFTQPCYKPGDDFFADEPVDVIGKDSQMFSSLFIWKPNDFEMFFRTERYVYAVEDFYWACVLLFTLENITWVDFSTTDAAVLKEKFKTAWFKLYDGLDEFIADDYWELYYGNAKCLAHYMQHGTFPDWAFETPSGEPLSVGDYVKTILERVWAELGEPADDIFRALLPYVLPHMFFPSDVDMEDNAMQIFIQKNVATYTQANEPCSIEFDSSLDNAVKILSDPLSGYEESLELQVSGAQILIYVGNESCFSVNAMYWLATTVFETLYPYWLEGRKE